MITKPIFKMRQILTSGESKYDIRKGDIMVGSVVDISIVLIMKFLNVD